jgi:glycerol kinase
VIESTAMGAAYLAGIHAGIWTKENIKRNRSVERVFKPTMDKTHRDKLYKGWLKAIERTKGWLN